MTKKKGTIKKDQAETGKAVMTPCVACNGRGYTEKNAGLLQIECRVCHGRGKVNV